VPWIDRVEVWSGDEVVLELEYAEAHDLEEQLRAVLYAKANPDDDPVEMMKK
jgi:hypothetical protein